MNGIDILIGIVSIIFGYILGAILPAYLIGRLKGFDIREEGTKNPGTTNAFKVLGLKLAIPIAIYDTLKGLLAMLIAFGLGANFIFMQFSGIAVIVGHVFPFYLRFRGGQGVATAAGLLLYYLVVYFTASLATFLQLLIVIGLLIIVMAIFLYISKSGSLLSPILFPMLGYSVFVIFPTSGYNLFFVLILIHIATIGMYKVITEKKLVIKDEIFLSSWWRVAIRPATLLFLVFYFVFGPIIGISLIGIVALCFLFLDLSRFVSKQSQELLTVKVKSIFRKGEEKKLSSMTIFLFSTFIMIFVFGQMLSSIVIAVTTLLFLVFGDMFAKIFGLAYGRHKFLDKSIEGTLAYIGVIIMCCYILFTSLEISLPVLIVGAVAAPFIEILPLGMNDNFTVPIISGTIMAVAVFFGL
ncbi:MAG: glycerol-3-phosphate acyltransferase [Promethearchaeota archaeon]|jgi:glycerol-3-phosphate acyltransferase PlsY